MRSLEEFKNILKDPQLRTKVRIHFSSRSAGDDYDPYEQNYTYTNLNPLIINAFVRELTPETAFYKEYGIHQGGAKELLCEDKYENYFRNASKIEIDSIEYQVLKDGTGNRVLMTKRPFKMLRVVLTRNG